MQPAPAARDGEGLSTREYVGYALGDTASNLFFKTFGFFLTYYYVDVWGLDAAAVATMFAAGTMPVRKRGSGMR